VELGKKKHQDYLSHLIYLGSGEQEKNKTRRPTCPNPGPPIPSDTMPAKKGTQLIQLASTSSCRLTSPIRPTRPIHPIHPIHRDFHTSPPQAATPLPVGLVSPPPSPPPPARPQYGDRVERKRKQAEMLRQAKELRSNSNHSGKYGPQRKRFWKDVHVQETPGWSLLSSPFSHLPSFPLPPSPPSHSPLS
jgi:hypothetical protein